MHTQILLVWCFCCCFFFFFPLSLAHNKPTHQDQCSALLHFKHDLHTVGEGSPVASWNSTTDCCSWDGITCNPTTADVIGLLIGGADVEGEISSNSSLFRLVHLQRLDLGGNNFTCQFPSGFGHLTSLTHLNLDLTGLFGQIPTDISLLKNLLELRLISLSNNRLRLENPNLRALVQNLSRLTELTLGRVDMRREVNHDWCDAISSSLPHLQQLFLSDTNLSGPITPSIGNLKSLTTLILSNNNFTSQFPSGFGHLTSLTHLSLYNTGLHGQIPKDISLLKNLVSLDLSSSDNQLRLEIPNLRALVQNLSRLTDLYLGGVDMKSEVNHDCCDAISSSLPQLQRLDLSSTNLPPGPIPPSIGNLKSLTYLNLANSSLYGAIPSTLGNLDQLQVLFLSDNNLNGSIPLSFEKFDQLRYLDLSENNFSGTVDPKLFENLTNLSSLYLSNNHLLTIQTNVSISQMPNLRFIDFSGCNVKQFPKFLRNQPQLYGVHLSNTTMAGQIPNWVWTETLTDLNLSHNSLTDFERPLPNFSTTNLENLDLHSNKIQESLPTFPPTLRFLSLSNNSFTGEISHWICNTSQLDVLDLSHNQLSGIIPPCLGNISSSLSVLDVRGNKFHGVMPQDFSENCGLEILKFSDNQLEGRLARSLASCRNLKVLDMGNNHIHDTFPHWLGSIAELKVLILRSNRFHGRLRDTKISTPFPKLHIIDLSNNSFSGTLSTKYFQYWKAMMTTIETNDNPKMTESVYYQYEVKFTNKGQEMEYTKDLLISLVNVVDMSRNRFDGPIPESIGRLKSLITLNLSRNYLVGEIPSVMGNLTTLQSLDLSQNTLSGKIPVELAHLTWLSFLNLSWNLLEGRIPPGTQFDTFSASSFEGNARLCGLPLPNECRPNFAPPPVQQSLDAKSEDDFSWVFSLAGYASGLISGIVIEHFILWRNRSYFMRFMRVAKYFQENSRKKKIKKKKTLRRENVL